LNQFGSSSKRLANHFKLLGHSHCRTSNRFYFHDGVHERGATIGSVTRKTVILISGFFITILYYAQTITDHYEASVNHS